MRRDDEKDVAASRISPGGSSRVKEFNFFRSRLPTLWSLSYFAATVGSVTETAVRKYVEGQKGK